jgi:DoxX-like protein
MTSTTYRWTGRTLTTLAILFMLFDSIGHLLMPAPVASAFATLGFPASTALGIGLLELALTVLYAIPRTAIVGAILLTGYLGGAIAVKVRIAAAPFDTLFPLIIAALIWGGVYLRDPRVRTLIFGQP